MNNDSVTSVAPGDPSGHPQAMRTGGTLAAVLVAVLLAGCGASDHDAASLGDSTKPVPAGLEAGCPDDDSPLRLPSGDLPFGAVAVRLCPGAPTVGYDGTSHGPFVQPVSDELTTGVEPLIDLVNGLPEHEPGACPGDGGPLLVYWFRYADGDARAVAYGERGCHVLTVGEDRDREDGQALAQAFADALLSQRAATTPPQGQPLTGPDCPLPAGESPVSMLPQVPLALTAATWCQGVGPRRMRSAPVPPSLLRRLNEGLIGKPVQARGRCKPVVYTESIEGITDWGDRVSYQLVSRCRIYTRVGYGRDTAMSTFEAAPDLISALRALRPTEVQRLPR